MRHSRAFAAASSLAVLFVALVACSSPPAPSGDGDGTDTKTADSTKNKSDSGKPATDSGGGSNPTNACSAKTDAFSCFDCCDQQVGLTNFDGNKIWDDCACDAPGACKTACATTYCKAPFGSTFPEEGDACDKCLLAQNDTCGKVVDDACAKDATCAKAIACSDAAKCNDKPLPPDEGESDGGT